MWGVMGGAGLRKHLGGVGCVIATTNGYGSRPGTNGLRDSGKRSSGCEYFTHMLKNNTYSDAQNWDSDDVTAMKKALGFGTPLATSPTTGTHAAGAPAPPAASACRPPPVSALEASPAFPSATPLANLFRAPAAFSFGALPASSF